MRKKREGDLGPLFYCILNACKTMITEKQVKKIVDLKLEGSEVFLVDVLIKPNNKIYIFIDGDRDISIDDCISLSRHVEGSFDRDKEDFELNVSSTGLEMPLKMIRQYKKHLGKKVSILKNDGVKLNGVLDSVEDKGINLIPEVKGKKKKDDKTESMFISYSEIKETKRMVSFKN
jgi:ribosome maturation factor RimP